MVGLLGSLLSNQRRIHRRRSSASLRSRVAQFSIVWDRYTGGALTGGTFSAVLERRIHGAVPAGSGTGALATEFPVWLSQLHVRRLLRQLAAGVKIWRQIANVSRAPRRRSLRGLPGRRAPRASGRPVAGGRIWGQHRPGGERMARALDLRTAGAGRRILTA
ncbi:hypothetical protein KCP78_25550 [Salmonella enterica subsp. enterica]|nr:hypothetical protein KCP78_25550 [Salmonella enterica subsp. enterica]